MEESREVKEENLELSQRLDWLEKRLARLERQLCVCHKGVFKPVAEFMDKFEREDCSH